MSDTVLQLPLLTALPAGPPARLDQRARGTSFHTLAVRSVLNGPASTGMGFWSLNPYVGCEFGCTYCYARDTHRWTEERAGGQAGSHSTPAESTDLNNLSAGPPARLPAWLAFERRILVKTDAPAVLARTLEPAKLAGHTLVIGTATDPYQPAERRFRITRQVLEHLVRLRGLSIGLITKSPLVTRDLDLLRQLAERHEVSVNISLATVDPRLARRLEPRSPAPHARLRALARLTGAGIHAGMLIAPILPGITDDRAGLAALMAAGKAAGARYVVGSALRLGPAARHRFLPFLGAEFPELAERYRRRYGAVEGPDTRQQPGRDYTDALQRRLQRLQREYGFPVSEGMRRRQQLEGRLPRFEGVDGQGTLL